MTITPMDPLSPLLSSQYAPAFIHLHHPHHPSTSIPRPSLPSTYGNTGTTPKYAQVDLIELNTPKLLYSAILHRLAAGRDAGRGLDREASSWDEFAQGMRDVMSVGTEGRAGKKSAVAAVDGLHRVGGEGEKQGRAGDGGRAVVMITHAERLRSVLESRWAGITRAGELIGVTITIITASKQTWDHLRPYAADAPEPVHVFLPPPSRADLSSLLIPTHTRNASSSNAGAEPSNPFLSVPDAQSVITHPLWPHFCNLLLASFAHLAPTAAELSFLAEPLWTLYTAKLPPHAEQHLLRPVPKLGMGNGDGHANELNGDAPQPLDITVKLLTDLKYAISPAFASASESLLSGGVGRSTFLASLLPASSLDPSDPDGMGMDNPLAGPSKRSLPRAPSVNVPYVAKFLLIAAYLASQNPPRTDLRLFGRGLTADGKRKKGGGTRRAGYGRVKVGKVPQRLLGPKPFPLERGLAIWAALYAENAKRPDDLEGDDGSSESDESDGGHGGDEGDDDPSTPSKRRRAVNGQGSASDGLPPLPQSTSQAKRIRQEDWLYSRAERESERAERKRRRQVEREESWEEADGKIPDLEAQGLVKRVSPPERLDNVQIRCEIGYEAAVGLAKEVGLVLDEYLYEAQA